MAIQHQEKDVLGLRAGYLLAREFYTHPGPRNRKRLVAVCDCGKEVRMPPGDFVKLLRNGNTSSCGCKRGETVSRKRRTHGMSKHPAFAVWRSMLDRCRLPTHQAWRNYGGRGITVCARWQESFENFWADMHETYAPGLSLDRADNSAGYCKANCRWVSPKVQANNRRGNRMVGDLTVAQFSEATGINQTTVLYRLVRGVPPSLLAEAPNVARRFSTSSTAGHLLVLFASTATANP